MRIVASNPDTLGDLVLRQPMYRALADAGHELLLIVRPTVRPLTPYVAPGVRVLELPHEVYAADLPEHWEKFAALFAAVADFRPDLLLIAPYQWTLFEEELARRFADVPTAGLNGHLFAGDPHQGKSPSSQLAMRTVARVDVDEPEYLKNAALTAAVLDGSNIALPTPRLAVDAGQIERASEILQTLGLAAGDYFVACVTGTAHVSLKAWHASHWASLLSRWNAATGRRFLFVGLHSEEADAAEVQRLMGVAGERCARWMPQGGTLDELIGLAHLSAGYAGHDTGPMHIAAAMDKPTLAIFGGGHRLRFAPTATPSVTLTVGVPCAGCGWICTFATSHCVKAVDVESAYAAAMDLEQGRVAGREIRVLAPSQALQLQMIAEGAAFARCELRRRAQVQQELEQAGEHWSRDVAQLREQSARQAADIGDLQLQVEARAADAEKFRLDLAAKGQEANAALLRLAQTDDAIREKEQKIQQQHELLKEMEAKLTERDLQLEQLALQRSSMSEIEREVQTSREEKCILVAELTQLRSELQVKMQESGRFAAELAERHGEMELVRNEINGMIDQVHQGASAMPALENGQREAPPGQSLRWNGEIDELRQQIQRLEERLRALEPGAPPVRRGWREIGVQWIIGKKHHIPRAPRPLPSLSIILPILGEQPPCERTIGSILTQNHAHFEVIVVTDGASPAAMAMLEAHRDRIDKVIIEPQAAPAAALARGFGAARCDVIGVIYPGDEYEPGALLRVAQEFSRRRVHAVEFENVIAHNGWRFASPASPRTGVYELLRAKGPLDKSIFFSASAYRALGGLDPTFGAAALWEWQLRLVRRFGVQQAKTHVRAIPYRVPSVVEIESFRQAKTPAEAAFGRRFGWLGRLRCTLIDLLDRVRDVWTTAFRSRLNFADPSTPAQSLPKISEAPAWPAQPVSPLTHRLPDRLLFSGPDTLSGDRTSHLIYYDAAAGLAMSHPPIAATTLEKLYAAPAAGADAAPADSPFAGYRGSRWRGWLARVPSPYWWAVSPRYDDTFAADALGAMRGLLNRRDANVRLLNVACFRGEALDHLRAKTAWQLCGTETNLEAIAASRAKGYTVWETSAQDAALTLPVGELFDVIVISHLIEHLQNPLLVLRRLRQLLRPGGWLVFNAPNLDSRHIDIFGPTWGGWLAPYHRVVMSRRAVRQMSALADFRVHNLSSRTHPYPTCRSVQLNRMGLMGVAPEGTKFSDDVASRGVRLTGWSRLLWDWRGRGDFLLAVLQQQ